MSIGTKKVKFRTLVLVVNIILVVLFQSVYVRVNMNRLEEYAQNAEAEAFETYHSYLCDNFSACMYEVDMLRSFIERNKLSSFVKEYLNLMDEADSAKRISEIKQIVQQISVSGNVVKDFIIFGDNFNQKNLYCNVKERKLDDKLLPSEDALSRVGLDGVMHTNLGYLVQCKKEQLQDVRVEVVDGREREAVDNLIQFLEDEYIVCDYIAGSFTVIRLNKEYVDEKFQLEDNNKFIVYHSAGRPVLYFNADEDYVSKVLDELDLEKEYFENNEYSYCVSHNLYGKLNVITEHEDYNGYFSFANSKYIYILFVGNSVLISLVCLYLFSNKVFKKIDFLYSTIKKQTKSDDFGFMNVSKKSLTFSKRLLFTFVSSSLLSLIVVSLLMNTMVERETRDVAERLGKQLSQNYASECMSHYERYNSISTVKIEKYLQEYRQDDEQRNTEITREFEENFYYETTYLPGYLYAFIVDTSGEVLYQTVFSSQKQVSVELIRNAMSQAKELEHFETQGVFVPVNDLLSGKETIAFVKSIYCDGINKGTIVIVSDVPKQPVNSDDSTILTDFLITNDKDEVLIGKASLYNEKLVGTNEMFDANNKIIYSIDESTADYIGKSVVLTYYNFYVNQIRAIQYLNLVWSLIIAAICIVVTFFLRRILVKPFSVLMASMNVTPEQGYQSIPENFAVDEVDTIAVAYNKMMGRMEHLVEESIRKEAERSELELLQAQTEFKMLEQQMNPHFLFNTLECVNLLALRSGEKNISKIVQSLSMILRYAISKETRVKVGREIQVLESYIEIQRFRFGDRISIELDVDESLFEINMIKFVLQPILENAISHGVGNLTSGGRIEIVLGCYETGLEFRIRDNGVGMSEEKLQKLRESLENKTADTEHRREGGIGLRNVYRRIALYYKGQGALVVYSAENKGTEVIVRLPFDCQ